MTFCTCYTQSKKDNDILKPSEVALRRVFRSIPQTFGQSSPVPLMSCVLTTINI